MRTKLLAFFITAVVVLSQFRGGPMLARNLAGAMALASMALAAASAGTVRAMVRHGLALASAVLAGALFAREAPLGASCAVFVIAIHAWRAAIVHDRRNALISAATVLVAVPIGFVASPTGALAAFESLGAFGACFLALKALVVVALLDGRRVRDEAPSRIIPLVLAFVTLAFVVRRLVEVAGSASNDGALFWAEEPFLVDMTKLDAHLPLYGPIDRLDSYTYSPLMQLAHHASLAPFGLELSLGANRLFTLFDQLFATVLVSWAVAPHVREGLARLFPSRGEMWAMGVAVLVGFSSMLAGALHPDHPTLACVAIAFALVVREKIFPRWLWWSLLVVVTPVATMAKLTGAGIGVGLGVVMLVERRWREIGALAISAVLAFATIPLFDATCGSFSAYAIGIQRSHPLEWSRLVFPPTLQFGAAAIVSVALAFGIFARDADDDARLLLRRAAIFFGCIVAAFFPAYVKYAGRENNLLVLLVGSVVLLVTAGAASTRSSERAHPFLAPAAALFVVALVWIPPARAASSPLTLSEQLAAAERTMTEDDAAHALTWTSASLRIRHGNRTPPHDCINIAYELFYGHRPEANLFFDHLGDGRYRSIVMVSGDLLPDATLRGEFATRLRETLDRRYARIYPPTPIPDEINHFVIYRLRD